MKTRLLRAALLVVVAGSYLVYVFQMTRGAFWTSGIGDWMDPYFINALLEHWYRSLQRIADPSSPPMYFPTRGTLGYSHGLVLYAVFYVPLRLFVHPFLAYNLTLLLVLASGIACLYLLLRKLGLSAMEALVLNAFFFTSKNVINGGTGTWGQRASVFLIPSIALILVLSFRMRGAARVVIASLGGLLAASMYIQDFYTAHFAVLLLALCAAPIPFMGDRPLARRILAFWTEQPRGTRAILIVAALTAAWAGYLLMAGGVSLQILGLRISSNDWIRPAFVAVLALAIFAIRRRRQLVAVADASVTPWVTALLIGALAGSAIFLFFYLDAYREHRSFPEEHLLNALAARGPAGWLTPLDFIRDLGAYDTRRAFTLVFTLGALAWLPWFRVSRRARLYGLWFLAVSFVVLVLPLTVDGFSIWRTVFEPLPGFAAIRDPKRVVYLYELAAVLATAMFLTRLPRHSVLRPAAVTLVLVLMGTDWNSERFAASRQIATYDRWIAEPLTIDRSCDSFFMKPGSAEYASRSDHMWTLYGIDAVFIALNQSIPTLNGYSAWFPQGWDLFNPHEAEYEDRVRKWIARHQLRGVCALDIEARTVVSY